ncbi:MAG TPA: DUF5060 domain-containing protein [Candidatus Acidoferrales bacterium]|nr:DUF5060 domain-containing protein [Candidatus Acidoferrales bacterium]
MLKYLKSRLLTAGAFLLFLLAFAPLSAQTIHTWEMHEIVLHAARPYANAYKDVDVWVELKGPNFSKRVYGFWDGGDTWRVRVVATEAGKWTWISNSNQAGDSGLNGKTGEFSAKNWTEEEKRENPTRHGFLRDTANRHALQYADGTPFFLVGDTWLAASTWRLPFTGNPPEPNYTPGPGITFEDAVAYVKRQGFNEVSMIAAFPSWASDQYPATYADKNGVYYRNAWEEFGVKVSSDGGSARDTAKHMEDEHGYRPFEIVPNHQGLPNFDAIVPQYFQSLDKKIAYLNAQGFIPMLETTRRDVAPAWKAYFNFNESYGRFVEYLVARYGAYNIILSKIHLDVAPEEKIGPSAGSGRRVIGLTSQEFNKALIYHLKKYGPMPFGQPVTALINHSTYTSFGHGEAAPWITLDSVGNYPRNNSMYEAIETLFKLPDPNPAIDLEPYYVAWSNRANSPAGERPPENSDRDNYFSRAMMYGCVLSGALVGHVWGHGAYDFTTTDEPRGSRPYIWEALQYPSAGQMQWMKKFITSEGKSYQDLLLASDDISPRKAPGSPETGLDGWAFMMMTEKKDLALLYFETRAERAKISDLEPNKVYRFTWYNTRSGQWLENSTVTTDAQGTAQLPSFPGGGDVATVDWAAKLTLRSSAS